MALPKPQISYLTSKFSMIFLPVAISLFFFSLATAMLFTSEPIVDQLTTGQSLTAILGALLVLLSPLLTIAILVLRLVFTNDHNNVLIKSWKIKFVCCLLFEVVTMLGFRVYIINFPHSILYGWKLIFAAFFISLHFVATSFFIGGSIYAGAVSTMGVMLNVAFYFGKETGTSLPCIAAGMMCVVVLAGIYVCISRNSDHARYGNVVHDVQMQGPEQEANKEGCENE